MRGHALVAGLLAVIIVAQATPRLGSTSPGSRALDQLNNSVTRPVPALPPPTGQHSADVWVPDRVVPVPDQPSGLMVPGHWERRVAPNQNYVPPMVITSPDGRTVTVPGGILPPPEQRQAP